MKKSNNQTGVSGEYYVAAELTRRGIDAAILLRNTENYDILAINSETKKQFCIQVKTTWETKRWKLTSKVENDSDNHNHYYVFVVLYEDDTKKPDFIILHSKRIAEHIRYWYLDWLNKPGKQGQPHNENNMRIFDDEGGEFKENWNNWSVFTA
jgi:hypothetical protein